METEEKLDVSTRELKDVLKSYKRGHTPLDDVIDYFDFCIERITVISVSKEEQERFPEYYGAIDNIISEQKRRLKEFRSGQCPTRETSKRVKP